MNTDESCLAANVLSKNCPSRVKLMHLTNRWGVLVMFCLRRGTHRFSELRRRIDGISEKMLTQTLRDLENDGFVIRKEYPVIPPHVEYSLSENKGETAIGRGFKLPLVISTSIKAKALIGIKIRIIIINFLIINSLYYPPNISLASKFNCNSFHLS